MFGRRFNFLTIFGIKIGIEFSWLFIAILLSWTLAAGYFPYYYPQLSLGTYWVMGVVGMLGLFICVILHELGHAMVAKHYKLPISQITLFIFGGVAEIKKEPKTPKVEFLMAIAGPIVSVLLSAGLYGLTLIGRRFGWPIPVVAITAYLALINIILAVFNMIPAFPLDGGRIFRSILWWIKKDEGWATKVATRMGSGFGMILVFLGIFSLITGNFIAGIWFVILGLFLQRAAAASRSQYYISHELQGEKVEKFMTKNPISVSPEITIKGFIEKYVYESYHHLYPVTEKGSLVGYVSLREIKLIPAENWGKTRVKEVMVSSSQFKTVTPETSALEALNLINQSEMPILLVVKGKQLIGILTAQDLFKLISIKLELENGMRETIFKR
ncbi:MAG: site-2 protease family protein [Rhabdochlamydiaceae bacterium]|jgi:Zn-dependent protease/CBS domain-containing protein